MRLPSLPEALSRFALAFCFLGFGIWELVQPAYWIGYLPSFTAQLGDPLVLIRLHGLVLTVIGLLVAIGLWLPFATGLAVLVMLEIVVNLWLADGFTEIMVRDVAILFFTSSMFADYTMKAKIVKMFPPKT